MNLYKFKQYKKEGKHIKLSEKAYHVTFKNRVNSIMKQGLKPMIGEGKNFNWCDNAVHLSSSKYGGLECMVILYVDKKEIGIKIGGELTLIEVDMSCLNNDNLYTGEAFEDWKNPNARVSEWVYHHMQ